MITAIYYDFDGVMTDNRVLIDQFGNESVFVNRGDGYAIARIKELGIPQVIISTEQNSVVERRAEKLRIPVIHGVNDKGEIIRKHSAENNVELHHAVFIGNDLNDMSAFQIVGFRGAPFDAESEIKELADWVSDVKGGYGVIRSFYRFIISSNMLEAHYA